MILRVRKREEEDKCLDALAYELLMSGNEDSDSLLGFQMTVQGNRINVFSLHLLLYIQRVFFFSSEVEAGKFLNFFAFFLWKRQNSQSQRLTLR